MPKSKRGRTKRPAAPFVERTEPHGLGAGMGNFRVYYGLVHPLFGPGYRIWDNPGLFEDHYWHGETRIIDYVDKSDRQSVLTVVIPQDPADKPYIQEWVRVRCMDWLKKAAAARSVAKQRDTEVTDEGFATKFPALFAFMCATTTEGQARELCKVQVFANEGTWKAALHDANTEHSLFVTIGSPADAFKALEKALTAESVDWRSWGKQKTRKK